MSTSTKKAINHLKKDKFLAKVIKEFPEPLLKQGDDYFNALVRSIIYQQLSGKAAGTIASRFNTLFKDKTPNPKAISKLKDAQFRAVGISGQKMSYLRDLSAKFLDKTIDSSNFHNMADEDIRIHLISVKGIGRWTADMFLMFTLNRLDVLPTGDLGIQKGFQKVFKMKKLPDVVKMEKLAKNWAPFRTIACLYLWKVADKAKEK